MGKIVITTNTSLDGVVQDPDGAEGFRLGGWLSSRSYSGTVSACSARPVTRRPCA
jgi:hypothetical protein